ncbi:membrane-bound transcription factor site-2 protease [Rhodnius prolixus]|uniref:membrane-bound transcription factor site-2 protease n=1 Tax=Rhodnius prolixus TaxID=13249 RepID=UPI003D18B129
MEMDDLYLFLIGAIIIHLSLLFFDILFKSCSHYPYLYFLSNTGLQILPLRINWYTTVFNRQIQKWGTKRPKLQMAWFSAGTWVSIAIMPFAIYLVIHTIVVSMKNSLQEERGVLLVEPLVPGWNLPASDLGYYITTLLISSVAHEIGHAMAAVREDVHLAGFSATLFFIVPLVVTHLDQFESLPPIKQLRVLCAGVWHNIFLAIIAAIIATTLPWLFYPFFEFGTGVQVKSIKKGSSISGEGGLIEGDKITQINFCPIRGVTSWQDCLVQNLHESNVGFCIPDSFIKEHDESVPAKHVSETAIDCCGDTDGQDICFEYIGSETEPLPLPQHSCLHARSVVELSSGPCSKHGDCPPSLHCFKPSLENSTKLIRIYRSIGKTVIFLGSPAEIYHSVKTTDFISIYKYLPSSLPDAVTKLCHFITIFSFGFAIVNIIPCFYFDGQHIIRAVTELVLIKKVPIASVRHAVSLCITIFGSAMLIIYLFVMFFIVT